MKGKIKTMFIEISKINSYGETGKALIKTEDIQGIKECHVESTKLFDNEGNVVSETPNPKKFGVLVATERGNQEVFYVSETEYQRLVGILTTTK